MQTLPYILLDYNIDGLVQDCSNSTGATAVLHKAINMENTQLILAMEQTIEDLGFKLAWG